MLRVVMQLAKVTRHDANRWTNTFMHKRLNKSYMFIGQTI